jgi:hypothetical protein
VLLPDFDYKLKPEQVQQSVIFDDERIRERKKAIAARMPYATSRAAAPSRPGGAAGLARPSAGIPRSVSRPAPVSTPRPKPVGPPVTAKVKPKSISVKLKPDPKPAAKPKPAAAVKPAKPAPRNKK